MSPWDKWDKLSGEKLAEWYVSATIRCVMLHWQGADGTVRPFDKLSEPEQKKCIKEWYLQLIAAETGLRVRRWALTSRTSKNKRESFYTLFRGCTHCGSETSESRITKRVNCLDCDGKGFWRSGTLGLTKNQCSRCDGNGQMQEVHSICSGCRQDVTEYWSVGM